MPLGATLCDVIAFGVRQVQVVGYQSCAGLPYTIMHCDRPQGAFNGGRIVGAWYETQMRSPEGNTHAGTKVDDFVKTDLWGSPPIPNIVMAGGKNGKVPLCRVVFVVVDGVCVAHSFGEVWDRLSRYYAPVPRWMWPALRCWFWGEFNGNTFRTSMCMSHGTCAGGGQKKK